MAKKAKNSEKNGPKSSNSAEKSGIFGNLWLATVVLIGEFLNFLFSEIPAKSENLHLTKSQKIHVMIMSGRVELRMWAGQEAEPKKGAELKNRDIVHEVGRSIGRMCRSWFRRSGGFPGIFFSKNLNF
ncbi:hypothetical protein B9Z55_011811 [Caenorhabditis nigoni]|uniref:Uncharacterized protein n=1 Tax=Caenorhabditis nigoni TaxID=1611254 RepID=A0A2G5ULS2_9PELO|nr:hypothetical protein B9Z55_011811 [Caenorhabditis nigoni]